MDTPTNNGIDNLKEEINQRREKDLSGLNVLKAAEIAAIDQKLTDDQAVLDQRVADAESAAGAAKAEAARSAAIAWPEDDHVTVQHSPGRTTLVNIAYVLTLLAVGAVEVPLNKVAFEYLRMRQTETTMAAIGLGLVVAIVCHFIGYFLRRTTATPKKRAFHVIASLVMTGLFVAVLWFVAQIRVHYMEIIGVEKLDPIYYVVLAGGAFLVGIAASYFHAPDAGDMKSYRSYKSNAKKHHRLVKKAEKLKSDKADLGDEAARKKEKIANKYKGLAEKKNRELDKELQKLTREYQKQQLAIQKAFADEELAAKKEARLKSKIDGASAIAILFVATCAIGLTSCGETAVQKTHELVILVDQTEMYKDRKHVLDNDGLAKFFMASEDYAGSISVGYLTGLTAQIDQKIERASYDPDLNNLVKMEETKDFLEDLGSYNIQNMLNPVLKEAEQSSLYQPLCAVLTKMSESGANKKTLVLISDMIENSSNASFYNEAPRIHQDPSYAKKLAEAIATKSCQFPKGSGVEVVIIYTPKEKKDDKFHNASMKVWKEIFDAAGITYKVLPNL